MLFWNTLNADFQNQLFLHYDDPAGGGAGEEEEEDDDDDDDAAAKAAAAAAAAKKGTKAGRFMTQEEIDAVVEKRSAKARRQAKDHLGRLEALQESLRLEGEQKEQMEMQIEQLRRQTMTSEEIAKREKKKADEQYAKALEAERQRAALWEGRYKETRITGAIEKAAREQDVLPTSVPFLEAFLAKKTKLIEKKDEKGMVTDFEVQVDFTDQGADGKPIEVQWSVDDTVKRMKEQPEQYGHLFKGHQGGLGGGSGTPGKSGGFTPGMSMEAYLKTRRENPSSLGL